MDIKICMLYKKNQIYLHWPRNEAGQIVISGQMSIDLCSFPVVVLSHWWKLDISMVRGVWCPALLTSNSAGAIVPPCGWSWTALAVLSSSACHDNNFESIVFDNDPSTGCNWGRNSDYLDLTNIFNVINGNLFSVVDLKKKMSLSAALFFSLLW